MVSLFFSLSHTWNRLLSQYYRCPQMYIIFPERLNFQVLKNVRKKKTMFDLRIIPWESPILTKFCVVSHVRASINFDWKEARASGKENSVTNIVVRSFGMAWFQAGKILFGDMLSALEDADFTKNTNTHRRRRNFYFRNCIVSLKSRIVWRNQYWHNYLWVKHSDRASKSHSIYYATEQNESGSKVYVCVCVVCASVTWHSSKYVQL